MLLQVILPFERLPTGLAGEGDVVLVRPLVDHEVVWLGKPALTVLADELTFGPHFATEFPTVVGLNWHYGEHRKRVEWRPVGRHTGKTMYQVRSLQHIRLLSCTVKGKLSPLRACGSRTWVSTPRRTDPRLPVPITLPLVPQRGKSEPRGECSHETCRLGSA